MELSAIDGPFRCHDGYNKHTGLLEINPYNCTCNQVRDHSENIIAGWRLFDFRHRNLCSPSEDWQNLDTPSEDWQNLDTPSENWQNMSSLSEDSQNLAAPFEDWQNLTTHLHIFFSKSVSLCSIALFELFAKSGCHTLTNGKIWVPLQKPLANSNIFCRIP